MNEYDYPLEEHLEKPSQPEEVLGDELRHYPDHASFITNLKTLHEIYADVIKAPIVKSLVMAAKGDGRCQGALK